MHNDDFKLTDVNRLDEYEMYLQKEESDFLNKSRETRLKMTFIKWFDLLMAEKDNLAHVELRFDLIDMHGEYAFFFEVDDKDDFQLTQLKELLTSNHFLTHDMIASLAAQNKKLECNDMNELGTSLAICLLGEEGELWFKEKEAIQLSEKLNTNLPNVDFKKSHKI